MKKKILATCSAILIFISLASCAAGSNNYASTASLIKVPNQENLYYHINTGVVYIVFNEYIADKGYGYMSPYYSENGNLYRYDLSENKMVEIVK